MTKVIDPWLLNADGTEDPFAVTVDFSSHPDDTLRDPDEQQITEGDPVLESHSGLDPQIVETPVAPVATPPAPVEEDQPETFEVEGGSVTLEKERGQWKATLFSESAGKPQVYWGRNKNDLLGNVLKAQLNATKKIRELNSKLKLGTPAAAPQQRPVTPAPATRELTADEIFEIKTQLESNPALALDNLFAKTTGLTVQQLVSLAQEGRQASIELRADAVNRAFRAANPDFYPDEQYKNFELMLKWLAKFKLGKVIRDNEVDAVFTELVATGHYTVENLEEAFQDLSTDGLLVSAPKQPKQTPPATAVTPQAPAPVEPPASRPDSRIVNTVVRPRAATGIRATDVTPVNPPATPKAPSVDDLDNMSDEEHQRLWEAMRRARVQSRRSN